MDNNKIIIIGAKENNLKNISLDIDKHKFKVQSMYLMNLLKDYI